MGQFARFPAGFHNFRGKVPFNADRQSARHPPCAFVNRKKSPRPGFGFYPEKEIIPASAKFLLKYIRCMALFQQPVLNLQVN